MKKIGNKRRCSQTICVCKNSLVEDKSHESNHPILLHRYWKIKHVHDKVIKCTGIKSWNCKLKYKLKAD